ncbi:MAG: hypothetical protein JO088_00295, partial [Acidobacteria bacterium]|nr:hypothetical protein [Acidobacteriota bacterium]
MAAAILQFLLALVAGVFIFWLWRRVTAVSRPIFWLVTVGTLVRAVGGLLGFWISYLELPVARSLQLGRGLWFFGVDAAMYFDFSAAAAARGPMAIVHLDKGLPSPFFLQVLAVAILLFGTVSSVAILLNVVAYLASCRIILSFDSPDQHRFAVFAIAVLSLAPSVVVWSLQPMKDVVFFFLIIAFFCSARMWQQLWRDTTAPMPPARGLLLWPAAMAAMLYGISGIRWYFAFMVLLSSLPFLLLAIIPARRRLIAGAIALLVFVLLAAAFFAGGSRYVPESVRAAVRNIHKAAVLPKTLVGLIVKARSDFDRSGGATLIGAGGAIRKLDHHIGAEETRVAATRLPPPVSNSTAGPAELAAWRARTAARRATAEPAHHRKRNPATATTT